MRYLVGLIVLVVAGPAFGATCKILEFDRVRMDASGNIVPVADFSDVNNQPTEQNVTYTTATSSSAFQPNTRFIRIVCDAKAHFEFNGTATASDSYFPADTPEYLGVAGGQTVSLYDGSS